MSLLILVFVVDKMHDNCSIYTHHNDLYKNGGLDCDGYTIKPFFSHVEYV
ncbi:MAG: hypothetical protein WAT46_02275 [Saprospiraceae bacterium]